MSFFSITLLIFCLYLSDANATDKVIKLATFEYPPLFHTSKNGSFSGTVGETVLYICEKADLQCSVEVLPFKRAYQKLQNKQVDGLITIEVKKFKNCCISTSWNTPWKAGLFSYKEQQDIPILPDKLLGNRLIIVAGMRSPYEHIPNLDRWVKNGELTLFQANNVFTATRMFLKKRATYLWGSEEFYWYFDKQPSNGKFNFRPLVIKPIVVWFQKDKKHISDRFNQAFKELQTLDIFNEKMLLKKEIMQQRYIDAPYTH